MTDFTCTIADCDEVADDAIERQSDARDWCEAARGDIYKSAHRHASPDTPGDVIAPVRVARRRSHRPIASSRVVGIAIV